MSTPTRIPANVAKRPVLLAGVLVAALLAPAGAAAAETRGPRSTPATVSLRALRAERDVLVRRIAALTDEATTAEARAAEAERRRTMSAAAAVDARRRFAVHAVNAYLDGVQDSEEEQLRRRVWGDSLAATDRRVLIELQRALGAAEKDGDVSAAALDDARRLRAELDATRATLERTIAERVEAEREAARARRAAAAAGLGTPRHRRATMSQHELMQRYRFGPGGVPEGLVATGEAFEGRASWYGPGFDGRPTASGAIYDQEGWTVAHRTLPLGTILLVSREGRSVVVLVNDRGPYVDGRVLDLSHAVADALGTVRAGVATVRAELLVPA